MAHFVRLFSRRFSRTRCHTSQRRMGIFVAASKPRRTLPPSIDTTVTLINSSTPSGSPTATDSSIRLVKTSMTELHSGSVIAGALAAPGSRRHARRELKYLHHRPRREDLHHGARGRLDFCVRFAHLHPCDPLDLLPQCLGGVDEQLPVKFLHLRRARLAFGQV